MSDTFVPSPFTSVRGYIRELDGLRGIAIALVMIHHFWPRAGPLARWQEIAHLGWIGVDLFFVISGFLITGILLDTRGDAGYFRNFYARRALRIFPLYYAFLTVAFILIPMAQGGSYFQTPFLRESGSPWWYYLYIGNLREAIIGQEPAYVLAPLWSLSIEEQFYISFPLIVFALSPWQLRGFLISLVLLAPIFRTVTALVWPANERVQYLATVSRVDVLSLGALIALGFRSEPSWLPSRRTTGLLLVAAIIVCGVAFSMSGLDRTKFFGRTAGYSVVAFTFALLVLWSVQSRGTAAAACLRIKPLVGLGTICYGVYILQRPAEVLLGKAMSRLNLHLSPETLFEMAGKCVAAILLAVVSWNLFEQPILSLKRRFVMTHHPLPGGKPKGT